MRRLMLRPLLALLLFTACRSGACRPDPVPACDPKDGTCVDQAPTPPVLTPETK